MAQIIEKTVRAVLSFVKGRVVTRWPPNVDLPNATAGNYRVWPWKTRNERVLSAARKQKFG